MGKLGIEQLARYWTSASQEARLALYLRTAAGETKATLEELRLAIILAESEAGEVGEG